jgi:hypothetical protein
MNWYKKAQTYNDIIDYPEEYVGEDNEAHRYFSIGQNEETTNDSFCWIWVQNQLHVAEGPTSHGMAFGHMFEKIRDVDNYNRGWYDPIQELISVVSTNYIEGINETEEDLPSILRRSLRRKFGQEAEIIIF